MLEPTRSMRFESWQQLIDWLPAAGEPQLMTVFVWASAQADVPAGERGPLEQARRGAFEELVRRCQGRLRSYLLRRHGVRDQHLVDDIMQETLLQIYSRAEQYDPTRSFWGWIYRIAHNKSVDQVRRKKPGLLGGMPDAELESQLVKLSGVIVSPETDAIERERHERLHQAITRLPGKQRRIVERKLAGVKGVEIAQELGRSSAYVSAALQEAYEVIKDHLGD